MAHVAVRDGQGGSFLGIPIEAAPRPWGSVDILRVRSGKVVERQGGGEGTGLLHLVATAPLDLIGPVPRVVTLERITLPPGARYDDDAFLASRVLLAESGDIHLKRAQAERPESSTEDSLAPGTMVVVAVGGRFTATNSGDVPAILLRLAIALPQTGGPAKPSSGDQPTGDAIVDVLAGSAAMLLPDGPLTVGVGRVLLAPGARLSLAGTSSIALVSAAEGRLGIATDGAARLRRGDSSHAAIAAATIGAAEGVVIEPGTSFAVSNDGETPAAALLIAITATAP